MYCLFYRILFVSSAVFLFSIFWSSKNTVHLLPRTPFPSHVWSRGMLGCFLIPSLLSYFPGLKLCYPLFSTPLDIAEGSWDGEMYLGGFSERC